MAFAIEWDGTGERFYENGVDRGVLFRKEADGSGYEKGVVWNGLTAVNESHEGGDKNDIFADNIKYLSLTSQERFSGTIEAYTYPEEFEACDGSAMVADGVFASQQLRRPFGFSYRTMIGNDLGQEYYKIHIVWNATAEASDKDNATQTDSPDAKTFSWSFSTDPVTITQISGVKPTAHFVIDSRYIPSEKLTIIENKLYGTAATTDPASSAVDPALPTPDWIIEQVGTTNG